MLTFNDFKSGPGSEIARRLGVPCSSARTWAEYARIFRHHASDTKRFAQIRAKIGVLSSGETAVACALLHAVDYSWLADEVCSDRTWRRLDNTHGNFRFAVVAALLRQDADSDQEATHG